MPCAQRPSVTDAPRPAPDILLRHVRVDGLERPTDRNASPSGNNTPSTIMSPAAARQGADRDKPGRPRADLPADSARKVAH